jgi:hypothetical protein
MTQSGTKRRAREEEKEGKTEIIDMHHICTGTRCKETLKPFTAQVGRG